MGPLVGGIRIRVTVGRSRLPRRAETDIQTRLLAACTRGRPNGGRRGHRDARGLKPRLLPCVVRLSLLHERGHALLGVLALEDLDEQLALELEPCVEPLPEALDR